MISVMCIISVICLSTCLSIFQISVMYMCIKFQEVVIITIKDWLLKVCSGAFCHLIMCVFLMKSFSH